MSIWKALFGGSEEDSEQEKKTKEDGQFDLFKYDGIKALRMGQFDYAVKCLERALEMREDPEARDCLAQALLRRGDLDEAMNQYRKLAELEPDNDALLSQMAHIAYMQEDYEHMAQLCEKSIALNADNAQAHYQRAQAYLGVHDVINAIAQLTTAIKLKDDLGDAYLLRGQTLLKLGDADSADADATYLMERVGDNEDVLLLKARVVAAKGNRRDAILLYNKVIEQNPFHVDAYRERGKLYFEEGESQKAKEDADKVMELDPQAMADVNGEYSAEGIEQKVKQAYSNINPFGI